MLRLSQHALHPVPRMAGTAISTVASVTATAVTPTTYGPALASPACPTRAFLTQSVAAPRASALLASPAPVLTAPRASMWGGPATPKRVLEEETRLLPAGEVLLPYRAIQLPALARPGVNATLADPDADEPVWRPLSTVVLGGQQRPGATPALVKQAVEEYVECGGRVIEVTEPFAADIKDGLQNQIFYCGLDSSHFTLIQPMSYTELTTGLPSPTAAALPPSYAAATTACHPISLSEAEDWGAATWRARAPLPPGVTAAHYAAADAGSPTLAAASAAVGDRLRKSAAAGAASAAAEAAATASAGAGRKQYRSVRMTADGGMTLEPAGEADAKDAAARAAAAALPEGDTVPERLLSKIRTLRAALSPPADAAPVAAGPGGAPVPSATAAAGPPPSGLGVDIVLIRDLDALFAADTGLSSPDAAVATTAARALAQLCLALEQLAAAGLCRGYALSLPGLALPPGAPGAVALDDVAVVARAAAAHARELAGLPPLPELEPDYEAPAASAGAEVPAVGTESVVGLAGTRLVAVAATFNVLQPSLVTSRFILSSAAAATTIADPAAAAVASAVAAAAADMSPEEAAAEDVLVRYGVPARGSGGSPRARLASAERGRVSVRARAAALNLLVLGDRTLEAALGPGGEMDLAEPAPAGEAEALARAQFEASDALEFLYAIERVYVFLARDAAASATAAAAEAATVGGDATSTAAKNAAAAVAATQGLPPPLALGVGVTAHAYAERLGNTRRFDEVVGRRLAPVLEEALAKIQSVDTLQAFAKNYRGGFRAWREGQRRLLEHATAPALQAVDAALLAELPGLSALPSLPSRALAAAMGAGLDAVTLPPLWTGALAPVVQAVRAVHERGLEEFEDDGSPLLPHCVPTVEDAALALTRLQQLKQEIIEHLRTVTFRMTEASAHEHTPLWLGQAPPHDSPSLTAPLLSGAQPPLEYWEGIVRDGSARAAVAANPDTAAHTHYPAVRARPFNVLDRALKRRRMGAFRERVGAAIPPPQLQVARLDEYALPY